jgi:hypothetical protein
MSGAFSNRSVTFIGVVRNCEHAVLRGIAKMQTLGALWGRAEIVLVTNDNKDKTIDAIRGSDFEKSGGRLVVLDGLAKRIKSRTERIAYARNEGLRVMWSMEGAPDDVCMMDMDDVNTSLPVGGEFVAAIETAPRDWVAVFANQQPYYYDIFALRHPKWCNLDCVAEVSRRPFYVPRRVAEWNITGARQIAIPKTAKPILVESAFGGFGLYRAKAIKDCWYVGQENAVEICEHVPFNREVAMKNNGGLYILPSLINDAPKEHIFRRFKNSEFQKMFDRGE